MRRHREPIAPIGLAVPPERRRFALSPLNRRRWQNFKANRRGYWSFWLFLVLFVVSLFAEFIANDKPFLVSYDGKSYFPVVVTYPETAFGGEFETAADYRDPYPAEADRREGRHHDLAADPLFLRHPQSRPADAGAVAADLDADRRAMQAGGREEGLHRLPRPRIQLARHRRSGPRRGGAADLRLPHLGAVRADPDDHLLGHRRRRRRRAGLFRRLDRSAVPALHRNLDLDARRSICC